MKPVIHKRVEYIKDTHVHLLKGLLRCGECGNYLTPYPAGKKDKNGVPYLYYACGRVVDFGKNSECKVRMVPAREFENIIKKCLVDLGNNKKLIESTIKNSTKMSKDKIKPLTYQKEKAEELLGKTTAEINRLVKVLKSQDLVGNEITQEYKKLLHQKSSLQDDIEKLAINIERCNQDVLDAEMIKKTLLAFDKVVNSLPIEDQKDLFNLLIKEITVWNFDPEKEKAPNELGAFVTKIRTKWLKVKLSLYQFPHIETYYKSLAEKKASSDIQPKWLPGRDTQRTINRLTMHIPIYLSFNNTNGLCIIEGNAPYGISTTERISKTILRRNKPVVCKPNPITIALKYQKMYEDAAYQSMEKVGQQFGVSRVRIHQMLNLLKLDQRIIDYIQNIKNPRQNNYWNEHRLRNIARLPKEKQYEKFQKLMEK